MDVIGSEHRASVRARADYFTGSVWLDPIAGRRTTGALRAYRVLTRLVASRSTTPIGRGFADWLSNEVGELIEQIDIVERLGLNE